MRPIPLLVTAAVVASTLVACAQAPPEQTPVTPAVDPALLRERDRRIAAFDSVVRLVNTDSLYKLWHAMLTPADFRTTHALMQCELVRLGYRYESAADVAIRRMQDTLWRDADGELVARLHRRMAAQESPPISRAVCGPMPPPRAPAWLRNWTTNELPRLPPSPDSATSGP